MLYTLHRFPSTRSVAAASLPLGSAVIGNLIERLENGRVKHLDQLGRILITESKEIFL